MTIAVDWDVKNQTKQTKPMKEFTHSKINFFYYFLSFLCSIILSASGFYHSFIIKVKIIFKTNEKVQNTTESL